MASTSYTSLCSSPPLLTRPSPSPCCLLKLGRAKNSPSVSCTQSVRCNSHVAKPALLFLVRASETDTQAPGSEEEYEEYEVELVQPYGLRFVKGRDGGTYIDAIAPGGSADQTGKFTVGDRVLATRQNLKDLESCWDLYTFVRRSFWANYFGLKRDTKRYK